MPKMYTISATITVKQHNGESTFQIPTFFLDANVQGITTIDGAKKVATSIINPARLPFIVLDIDVQVTDTQ